jgi:hypothetical protein
VPDCTWEIHYDLPPGREWVELIRMAVSLKAELTPLRLDYLEDSPRMSLMIGDIEALEVVIVRMARAAFGPTELTSTFSPPFWNRRLRVTLDNDDVRDSARWEELEPR